MTATLAPPPVAIPPARGSAPARRAIARWAWRLLRREWRQQLIILALLVVAVAATVVGLGLVVNLQQSDQALTGTANTRIDIGAPGQQLPAIVAAARQRFGAVEVIEHDSVPVPGSVTPVDLRAQDPHGAFGAPMLRLVSGRYPSGAGEVALTSGAATTFALKVGDSWTVSGRALRVVGIVENPKNLEDTFALVAAGQLSAPASVTLLLNAGGDALRGFHPPGAGVVGVMSTGADSAKQQRTQALGVLLLDTIGLTFIGLLAAAGFTVMAQRRLRALGMIGAIGATDRQVRLVMLSNGAAVGVVGATGGLLVGLSAWFGLRPAFEHLVGHRIDTLRLPWWAVVAGAVLAVLTSLAASWWPARAVGRMPIVAALSGRPAKPQPAHRFAVLGVALGVAGFVLLARSAEKHTLMIVTGILATSAGMLLLAPLGIRALAAGGRRAPVAIRLALRDLARYQARSGAAVAAASLAVGIASTIAISAAATQAADRSASAGNLPSNQLVVWLAGSPDQVSAIAAAAPVVPEASALSNAKATVDAIATALGAQHSFELDVAVNLSTTPPAGSPPDFSRANLAHPINEAGRKGWSFVGTPFVATPALLDLYRLPASAVGAGTSILTSRTDLSGAVLIPGTRDTQVPITVQITTLLPSYASAPNTVITEATVGTLGLTPEPVGWLLQAGQPLSAAQITDARHRAAAAGISIETRTAPDQSLNRLRDYATTAGVLLALGVLAMTVGLIRSETAGDLQTLTAAGASGRTRRTLTAATAGALALLGGMLGVAGAYLALIAWHWHDIDYLDRPPYANLAVIMFGLPVAALIGGWLFGRTPTSLARRPLE